MNESVVSTVFDLAVYILYKQGPMTAMKLEKLCYYAQAWSLAWDDVPLFNNRIEAWINGPVCPDLFAVHSGRYMVDASVFRNGNPDVFSQDQQETIDKVLEAYGSWTSGELSAKSHTESPWIDARKGLAPNERGCNEITFESMAEYYQGLI